MPTIISMIQNRIIEYLKWLIVACGKSFQYFSWSENICRIKPWHLLVLSCKSENNNKEVRKFQSKKIIFVIVLLIPKKCFVALASSQNRIIELKTCTLSIIKTSLTEIIINESWKAHVDVSHFWFRRINWVDPEPLFLQTWFKCLSVQKD